MANNTVDIKALKKSVDTKYAPLIVDLGDKQVTLKQVLRLDDEPRAKVRAKLAAISEVEEGEDDNTERFLSSAKDIVTILAGDESDALTKAAGDDPLVYLELFNSWMEVSQPGEA